MKKLLLVAILAGFCGLRANAQYEIRPTIGFNLSDVNTSPDGTSTSAKAGWQIGGQLVIGHRFHLYPGIFYRQTVTEYSISGENGTEAIETKEKIAAVQIPILVGFRLLDPDNDPFANVRLFAGPTLQFNTKNEFTNEDVDNQINWKKSTWGARLGGGLDIAFLFVDAGYEFGLSNTFETDETLGESFKDTKHNTFFLNAGVRIRL